MAEPIHVLFYLFCVFGFVWCDNIDFGSICDFSGLSVECQKPIVVDCNNPDDLSGIILSPNYPALTGSAELGKYQVTISSCPKSFVTLTLTDETFSLGTENNYFSVGTGLEVGSNSIPPILRGKNGDNELPNAVSSYSYSSSSSSLWFEANLPEGRAFFQIRYDIILLSTAFNFFNETSGIITSNGYGTSYPSETTEEIHLIDVTAESGEYVDLLLTVNEIDIKGFNGDYIKLGPGLDPSVSKDSAILSWRVGKGIQFLIDGSRAHLLFKVMSPVDNSEKPKGFSISYQVIEKNLTTVAPSTTPYPTSPTPLPFDPDILQTELVYKTYETDKAKLQLVEILQKYAESTGMFEDGGQIVPELSEEIVEIVTLVNCFHGWNVDANTCGQVQVIVRAFYQKGESDVTYAFPREKVKAAVREYGYEYSIYLPEDLANIYWILGSVSVSVVILIFVGLLLCWREKNRREYSKRSYQEIGDSHPSNSAESDISKTGSGNRFEICTSSGLDNPTFVYDEELYYDPEKGPFSLRSGGLERVHMPSKSPLRRDQEPERSAVLNISPITSNFQWQSMSGREQFMDDSAVMPSIMLPLAAVPERNRIFKPNNVNSPTSRDFPISFSVMEADEVEEVLYDNSTLNTVIPQRRFSPSSSEITTATSSQTSRTSSISTDQQIAHGITLTDIDFDEENETNL